MGRRLKRDDVVVVVAGRDKGAKGRILKVLPEVGRVLVEGVNVVRRHSKPTPQNPEGGILDKEMPIHVSNVMLWDPDTESPTRVRFRVEEDGTKVRVSVKSGKVLEG
ncbi:MAG: 50S ribosomal protein L24 [Sandaracinaceae bacterium]